MNTMFNTLLAAAAKVETPVDGQTGVWLKQGAAVINSAMTMTGAVVSSGQTQYVYNRGVARNTLIAAGGLQYVSAGGSALGVVVSNAPTSNTLVALDGYVSGLELFNASAFCNGSAGVLSGAILRASGAGYPTRLSCWHGSAADVTVSGGAVFNVSDAHIGSVAVYSGGFMPVYGGNTVVGQCTCNATCIISAYGGTFNEVVMNANGRFTAAGCSVNSVTVGTGRGVVTVTGGEFSNMDVHTLVIVYNAGGGGSNMTVGNSAAVQLRTAVSAFTITSGGSAILFSGGALHGVTVSAGGTLTVSSGGTALAVTSNAGATVTVLNGGYIEYA